MMIRNANIINDNYWINSEADCPILDLSLVEHVTEIETDCIGPVCW
jgi:hypothetical protein